jgi:hypothetical protein
LVRPLCDYQRKLAPPVDPNRITFTGLSVEREARIFYDFKNLHFSLLRAIAHARIFHAGGIRSFPIASHFLAFHLSYRDDCSGNPARAFYAEFASLIPLSIASKKALAAFEASKHSQDAVKTHQKAADPEFVDFLPVAFMFGERTLTEPIGIYDQPNILKYCLNDADFFMKQLRVLSKKGHAYRDLGTGKLVIGRMEERGSKWHWVPLTEQEIAEGKYDPKTHFAMDVDPC